MGKSKSKKQKDFQKVKLKVGRKLPKGDNVTNASFKSRAIKIVQQLPSETPSKTTYRKQNIRDLLSQCQHYSANTCRDAVTGLRELVTFFPDVLHSHLATVIDRTSCLFTHKDPSVRQAVIKFYRLILPKIPMSHIGAYFPLLSAHLCCGMTHIYDDIRMDSLFILDLLMESVPQLVVNQSNQILSNFIEQISRQRHGGKGGMMKNVSHSLSINPESKLSSQRWRMKVLKRLRKFLVAYLELNPKDGTSDLPCSVDTTAGIVKPCCDSTATYVQPFTAPMERSWRMPSFIIRGSHSTQGNDSGNLDASSLKHLVVTLVPLLLECWIEASPAQLLSDAPGKQISVESLSMMVSVTGVIQLLWQCIRQLTSESGSDISLKWLSATYQKEFVQHFMSYFPYSSHDTPGIRRKKKLSEEVSILYLNLSVCDIMTYFLNDDGINQNKSYNNVWFERIIDFLTDSIGKARMSPEETTVLERIMSRLLSLDITEDAWHRLMVATNTAYDQAHPFSANKQLLLRLLSQLALSQSSCFDDQSNTDRFLRSLPQLLQVVAKDKQQMAVRVLSAIQLFVKRQASPVLECLQDCLVSYLDAETGLLVLPNSSISFQRSVCELLFSVLHLDEQHYQALIRLCRQETCAIEIKVYLLQILHHRYMRLVDQPLWDPGSISRYLSFLISMLIGNLSATDETNKHPAIRQQTDMYSIIISEDEVNIWVKQNYITEVICNLINLMNNTEQICEIIFHQLEKILNTKEALPLTCCLGILTSIKNVHTKYLPIAESLADRISLLCCSLCLHLVGDHLPESDFVTNDFIGCVFELCSKSLLLIGGIGKFFSDMMNLCKGSRNADDMYPSVVTMSKMLRQQSTFAVVKLTEAHAALSPWQQEAAVQFPDLREKQWWSDLLYLTSLLQS